MSRHLTAVAALVCLAGLLLAAPAPSEATFTPVDLKTYTNVKLADTFHSGDFADNNLAKLPTGKQTFADVKFQVGEGLVQLGSAQVQGKPAKVEGIKVGRTLTKLHFLHATGYTTDEETQIAKYVIHYDDKTTADVEVKFGEDVVDWWAYPGRAGPTKGKVAWESENEASKGFDAKIRLYLKTWENPKPDKKVVTIDFIATQPEQTTAAPFCVAITAEDK